MSFFPADRAGIPLNCEIPDQVREEVPKKRDPTIDKSLYNLRKDNGMKIRIGILEKAKIWM